MQSCVQNITAVPYLLNLYVTRMQTSTDLTATKLFSAIVKECFSRMALVRIHQRLQSPGWTQILNTTFCRRTGRLIHRICLRLRTFGALWQQPFMPTPSLSHCKHWSHRPRKAWKSVSLSRFQNLIGSMPNWLKAVILFHGCTRTAYLYRCVWSGITGR